MTDYNQMKTYSLTPKSVDSLVKMCKKNNIAYSKMIRMFISYFDDNPTELKKLIKRYK